MGEIRTRVEHYRRLMPSSHCPLAYNSSELWNCNEESLEMACKGIEKRAEVYDLEEYSVKSLEWFVPVVLIACSMNLRLGIEIGPLRSGWAHNLWLNEMSSPPSDLCPIAGAASFPSFIHLGSCGHVYSSWPIHYRMALSVCYLRL